MRLLRVAIRIIVVGLIASSIGTVSAQNYPSKPIRIITSGVGGTSDFAARHIAEGISGPLGQSVVVENRGSGVAPGETASKAPPDGYTLLLVGGSFWIAPLFTKTPYDSFKDFSPISLTNTAASLLVVHPSVPVKSVKELIALAKARPGELNYSAGSGIGGSSDLAMNLFKAMAGVKMTRINFRNDSQEVPALISGEVQVSFGSINGMLPFIQSGRVRALAVTSLKPSALFPGLPPVAATLPGYESVGRQAIFAPGKTPETVIRRLNQEIVRYLSQPDTRSVWLKSGVEAAGSSPAEVAAVMKADTEQVGQLIRDLGVKVD